MLNILYCRVTVMHRNMHLQRHVCCWPVACMSIMLQYTCICTRIDSPVVRDVFGLRVSLLLHFCSFEVCLKGCCNGLFQVYSMWLCIAIMEDRNHFPFKGLNKAEPSSKTLIFKLFQRSVMNTYCIQLQGNSNTEKNLVLATLF